MLQLTTTRRQYDSIFEIKQSSRNILRKTLETWSFLSNIESYYLLIVRALSCVDPIRALCLLWLLLSFDFPPLVKFVLVCTTMVTHEYIYVCMYVCIYIIIRDKLVFTLEVACAIS